VKHPFRSPNNQNNTRKVKKENVNERREGGD